MKLVIVGGVAGGASAAARARRLNEASEIIIFERGEHISFANCGLPYHIGGVITDRSKLLVQTPEAMKKRFNIDVRVKSEVVAIDRKQKHVVVRELLTAREYNQPYDKLILSPGAEPVRPNISGINSANVFTLRSIEDMDKIKNVVDKQNAGKAIIIGGGYIGLEMAEMLRRRKLDVSVVELENQVFGAIDPEMASVVASELRLHGVELLLGTSVTAIEENSQGLKVQLSSGESLNCTMVIVSVGVRPESKLAKDAGLSIGQRNGIVVDKHMRTSDPDIYAVGDAVEVEDFTTGFATLIPLAGPANRQGRIVADNIMGKSSEYHKTQGTGICKVFDLAVGMTGLNEKTLKRLAVDYEKVYIHPASHATYYPGASQISLKLLFAPKDGKILGAQAVGSDGIDKRIDVLAVSIRAGLTVRDLKDLELSYAPPYSSAKDPINYAGFVASNLLDGDVRNCYAEDLFNIGNDKLLLDVRTPGEVEAGTIGGAINIPVDQLRYRLSELPKNKELMVFCQVGLRGYVACRILSQNGFSCRNLSGGYKTYRATLNNTEKNDYLLQKVELKDDAGAQNITQERKKMTQIIKHIDARNLQCPGPIMQLKAELDQLQDGQAVTISAKDAGFPADINGWCENTGNKLESIVAENGVFTATVMKEKCRLSVVNEHKGNDKTMVVFSNDFDKAMAAFIIANGAASMGAEVTMFFTFWGLNILRKSKAVPVQKNLVERMFSMMMPRGAGKLTLSKLNMAGMGTSMMKGIMRKKNVLSLEELINKARTAGVKLVACTMSMDLMGIKQEELIDGVEAGGVAMYLNKADTANVNLFI